MPGEGLQNYRYLDQYLPCNAPHNIRLLVRNFESQVYHIYIKSNDAMTENSTSFWRELWITSTRTSNLLNLELTTSDCQSSERFQRSEFEYCQPELLNSRLEWCYSLGPRKSLPRRVQ